MDCSQPGSSVHGILQARILEWLAISFSRVSSRPRNRSRGSCAAGKFFTNCATRQALDMYEVKWSEVKLLRHVRLFETPWTVAYQVPPSLDFPGKNTGMGCHFLLQEIFLTHILNPGLPHCRQTLYRLSHQGSLDMYEHILKKIYIYIYTHTHMHIYI